MDVFSIAASLAQEEELFASAAEAGLNAVFVIDAWHETHLGLARRYLDLCRRYGLDCRLSERKPAEIYAAELCDAECGEGCAVVTRDYDAVKAAKECAVLIFQGGSGGRRRRSRQRSAFFPPSQVFNCLHFREHL
ncbi:MAG: hypothetical protein RXR06_06845 [Thermoproteus sp.]